MPAGTPILQILQRVQAIKEAAERAEQAANDRAEDAALIKQAACNVLNQLIAEYQLDYVSTELPIAEQHTVAVQAELQNSVATVNGIDDDLNWLKANMPAAQA